MLIKATDFPLTVQYKLPTRFYGVNTGEGGPEVNEPDRTSAPFEEKYLAVGESFTVIGEFIAARPHTGVADSSTGDEGHGA